MPQLTHNYRLKMHPVEAYNCTFSLGSLSHSDDHANNYCILFENGAFYRAAAKIGIEQPNLTDINKLMAHAISAVTSPTRFGTSNLDKLAMDMNYFGNGYYSIWTLDYGTFISSANAY